MIQHERIVDCGGEISGPVRWSAGVSCQRKMYRNGKPHAWHGYWCAGVQSKRCHVHRLAPWGAAVTARSNRKYESLSRNWSCIRHTEVVSLQWRPLRPRWRQPCFVSGPELFLSVQRKPSCAGSLRHSRHSGHKLLWLVSMQTRSE